MPYLDAACQPRDLVVTRISTHLLRRSEFTFDQVTSSFVACQGGNPSQYRKTPLAAVEQAAPKQKKRLHVVFPWVA